jgi:hypothetical protein
MHRFINVVLAVKVTTARKDSIALICFGFFLINAYPFIFFHCFFFLFLIKTL